MTKTDDSTVKWIQSNKKLNSKVARWAPQLQGYNFDVKHKTGQKNLNVVALSRREYIQDQCSKDQGPEQIQDPDVPGYEVNIASTSSQAQQLSQKEYAMATFVYHADTQKTASVCNIDTQQNLEDEPEDDIDDSQLKDFHEEFHTNSELSQLQQQCPDFDSILATRRMDWCQKTILLQDSASKWCEAFSLKTQSANEIAHVLFREIFTRYGAPRTLVSDRGRNFMSSLIQALSEMFQTKSLFELKLRTNSACERMNFVILQQLRIRCNEKQNTWLDVLPAIMMSYRMTPVTQSMLHSPYYILYGQEMRMPIDSSLIPKPTLPQNFRIQLSQHLENLDLTRK
ncbi:uncharacterized protein LOC132554850 [Ylistrum balloti]|uniref:uncharacterized protein LOC132554850 n=1 Tax=Ylistrum balloti TaxID=509963 RepID=UPI0029058486|nr:uncharacterized protein LOC132554850 [Ylistrum balloti]